MKQLVIILLFLLVSCYVNIEREITKKWHYRTDVKDSLYYKVKIVTINKDTVEIDTIKIKR